jgi:hypothetical protein
MSTKSSNSRRLFVTVATTGLLAMGGSSAQAGFQVQVFDDVGVGVPPGAGEPAAGGECGYNFGIPSGCAGLGPNTTGFVTPPTTPPGNSGTATAAIASVSGVTSIASGSGSVSADLSNASVHLDASSAVGNGTEAGGSSVSEDGNYSDTLHYTVGGAGPTTVTPIGFTFTIDGSMQQVLGPVPGPFAAGELNGQVNYGNGGPPSGGDARFDLKLNSDTGYQTAIGYLDTYPSGAPGTWTYNAALTEFTYTDTFDLTGASGSFPISLDTFLLCEYGVVCNYGDTLQVGLTLPSDVTLTSDSGVFPTGTPSPTPTPEPGTLGLLAFGMAGVAVSRRWRLR